MTNRTRGGMKKGSPEWRAYQNKWARDKRAAAGLRHGPEDHAASYPLRPQAPGTTTLVDAEGKTVLQWVRPDAPSPIDIVATLKGAFADYDGASYRVCPPEDFTNALALYPMPDLHIGQYGWASEVDEDWDLSIAKRVISEAVGRVIAMTPATELAVVLGGGDQLHADNNENRTRSGNILQVDSRYPKVLAAACKIFVDTIDAALAKHARVEVRVLQGNHDEHAATALTYFLQAWYRNESRVVVDVSGSLFYWRRYGRVFLAATHGHAAKPGQMAGLMAARRSEDWGLTKHRYAHTFHIHHQSKFISEGGGCIVETHQTPIPKDAYNYGAGFLSGRSLQSIIYDPELGEVARSRVSVT